MKHKTIIGLILFLGTITITGAGCAITNNQVTTPDQPVNMTEKQQMQEQTKDVAIKPEEQKKMTEEKDKMETTKTEEAMEEKEVMQTNQVGMYKDYSPAALAEATKNGGKAVLFFWAAWCPYCKEANADFLANINKIPNNVTVLKTNYDTERTLKTKYGVTYQHTFVQVDAQGNQITKWNGGGTSELLTNIK